jgi:hypothetical protein
MTILLRKRRSGDRRGGPFYLVDISGLEADVKQMAGHIFFAGFFIPVIDFGQLDPVSAFNFREDIKILNPAFPAFYAITFHYSPPSL